MQSELEGILEVIWYTGGNLAGMWSEWAGTWVSGQVRGGVLAGMRRELAYMRGEGVCWRASRLG